MNSDDSDSRERTSTRTPALSWLPVLVMLGATVVGTYAQKIAKWVVCFHSAIAGAPSCSTGAKAEALFIGTLFTCMIAIAGAAAAAKRGNVTTTATVLTIIGALAGALLSLMDAASQNADYPQFALLRIPLYWYLICVLLFAGPLMILPRSPQDLSSALDLCWRLAVATLVGAVFGYTSQLVSELYWKGLMFHEWGATKFVVAPSATAIAVGAWAVALFDPYFRTEVWATAGNRRNLWINLYSLGAIVLAAGYGALFHVPPGGAASPPLSALIFVALALPGLLATGISLTIYKADSPRWRPVATAALIAGATSAGISAGLALLKIGNGLPSGDDILPFAIAQILASISVVLTAFCTDLAMSFWRNRGARSMASDARST